MKTTNKKRKKKFDAVEYMREQRDRLSEKLSGMSKEEVVEYFKKRNEESDLKPGA